MHQKLADLVSDLINKGIDLNFAKRELESAYIRAILSRHNGHLGKSANALGMHRNTLAKRLRDLEITPQAGINPSE